MSEEIKGDEKMKIEWKKDYEKLVDDTIKEDIEQNIKEYSKGILRTRKFLKSLDANLYPHVSLRISEYGRKGDREGEFELIIMPLTYQEMWVSWESSYTKSREKGEILSEIVAIITVDKEKTRCEK